MQLPCVYINQPLRAVWCKTRLLDSGGQFDQPCKLLDGAILARVLCYIPQGVEP